MFPNYQCEVGVSGGRNCALSHQPGSVKPRLVQALANYIKQSEQNQNSFPRLATGSVSPQPFHKQSVEYAKKQMALIHKTSGKHAGPRSPCKPRSTKK